MQSNQFRRTRVAAAVAGAGARAGRGPGVRRRLSRCRSKAAADSATRMPAARRSAEDASTMWSQSGRHVAILAPSQIVARRQHHHAVDQVQQRRFAAGVQPAARRQRRRCGQHQLRAEHVPGRADQQAVGVRPRHRRAVRPRRPTGTTAGSAATRRSSRRSRRSTSTRRSRGRSTDSFTLGVGVNYQQIKATFTSNANYSGGAARTAAQPAPRRGSSRRGSAAPFIAGHRGPRLDRQHRRRRQRVGLEHRRRCGTSRPTCASARTTARRSSTTCQGNVNFDNPSLPPLGPLAPVGARAVDRRQRAARVQRRRHVEHRAAVDHQRLVLQPHQSQVGRDGRRAVHGLVDASRT